MAKKRTAETAEVNEITDIPEVAEPDITAESAVIETAVTAEISKTSKVSKPAEQKYIYVGASLPGINTNTVFTGEIQKILDVPFVRELVIPVDKFTEFIKKKSVAESREAFCWRKSAEYAKTLRR